MRRLSRIDKDRKQKAEIPEHVQVFQSSQAAQQCVLDFEVRDII